MTPRPPAGRPWYFLSWRHGRRPDQLLSTWEEASAFCREKGGELLSIDTREKQSYISWVLDEDG